MTIDPIILNRLAAGAAELRELLRAAGVYTGTVTNRGTPLLSIQGRVPSDAPSPAGVSYDTENARWWEESIKTPQGAIKAVWHRSLSEMRCARQHEGLRCARDRGHEGPCRGTRTVEETWDAEGGPTP